MIQEQFDLNSNMKTLNQKMEIITRLFNIIFKKLEKLEIEINTIQQKQIKDTTKIVKALKNNTTK